MPPTAPAAATRAQRSLFGEILDWMLVPLLLLWPTSVLLTWLVAQNIAVRPYDRELGQVVRALARQVAVEAWTGRPAAARFILLPATAQLLDIDPTERRRFQVRGFAGELLAGDADLGVPAPDERAPGELRFRDDSVGAETARIAHLWIPAPGPLSEGAATEGDGDHGMAQAALVQVAETRDARTQLATEIIKGVVLPQLAVLPLGVLLVWLALARGIAPLNEVQQRIRLRDSADLSPLDERGVPEEVLALVHSINDLLARLDQTIGTQKRFLAGAAHQLKTPLAGLRTQAELAQREIDAGSVAPWQLKTSLQQISLASQRAAHMVDQLLAMARAESRELAARVEEDVDLDRLATATVRDFVPRALDLGIDLGYEGPPPPAPGTPRGAASVRGHPVLLGELLRNLVDNALLYTPRGGCVTVRVQGGADADGGTVVLQVEDSGPGIAPDEREHVFEPFYRALGTQVDGSGLGLAIVVEIARQHGASVVLDDAVPRPADGAAPGAGPGARFTLRFAAVDAARRTEAVRAVVG